MSVVRRRLTGVVRRGLTWLRKNRSVLTRRSNSLLRGQRHRPMIVPVRMGENGDFSDASLERLHSVSIKWAEYRYWPGVVPAMEQ